SVEDVLTELRGMFAFAWWRGGRAGMQSRALHKQFLRSILFLLQAFSAFYGFQNLPMAETYSFIFVMPVFTLIFAIIFLHEKVCRLQVMLMLVAFAGVLVVFRPGLDVINSAALVVLGGSAIGGLNQVFMRHLSATEGFGASLVYPVLFAAIISAAIGFQSFQPLTMEFMTLFVIGGVIAAAAHSLIVSAFYFAPASQIAPTQYSQIIWGVLYGYFFFGDVPDIYVIGGASMIIGAGIWLAKLEYDATHGSAHE
nr:DMT family transporter [Alphaproteobacteria bacterium]